MIVTITVFFTHTPATLAVAIKKACGHEPIIKHTGENYSNQKQVYLCEFNITKKDDQKILNGFKKLNVTLGEITPSPASILEDHQSLRHQNHHQ